MGNGISGYAVKNGKQVSCGFSGARLCAGNDIGSFQNQRNDFFLDGSRFAEAHGIQPVEQRGAECKIMEGHQGVKLFIFFISGAGGWKH